MQVCLVVLRLGVPGLLVDIFRELLERSGLLLSKNGWKTVSLVCQMLNLSAFLPQSGVEVTAGGGKELKGKRPPLQAYILKQGMKTLPKKEIEQIWKYSIIWGNLSKKKITIKGNNAYVSKCIHMILEKKNQEKR